jgi:hypothetical protein
MEVREYHRLAVLAQWFIRGRKVSLALTEEA